LNFDPRLAFKLDPGIGDAQRSLLLLINEKCRNNQGIKALEEKLCNALTPDYECARSLGQKSTKIYWEIEDGENTQKICINTGFVTFRY